MKLYLVILVTSVALVAASPTRNKEEPTENDLLEALLRVEQSLYNEETTVTEERTSCVIGWKQQGQTCERDCECCGVAATCIGDEKPSILVGIVQPITIWDSISFTVILLVSNGVSAVLCAA
uniref:U30-Hexatoxin-Hf1ae_1 n=1 Tax=Hadronyche formidabilis TaxID=426499 RepID=A0A4V2H9N1_HADFO